MYQAQTPAMEEYIRLTLKDLKTLTRGLAAGEHRLSHAAGEWKADLDQRLAAAQVRLLWTFNHDRDVALTMVQWSALTRVLRELVSNALQHARAAHVSIQISLEGPVLLLRVADDGCGRAPETWSHGLGLGGVRKRVKLIGGQVSWREQSPQGIVCEVQLAQFDGAG
jgi:signal transduction histidine kinase